MAAGVVGVALLAIKFFDFGQVPGWTTIMVVLTFGFSAQLLMTGILGEYVGRIYEEIKRRPLYIAARELNFQGDGHAVRAVHADREHDGPVNSY